MGLILRTMNFKSNNNGNIWQVENFKGIDYTGNPSDCFSIKLHDDQQDRER